MEQHLYDEMDIKRKRTLWGGSVYTLWGNLALISLSWYLDTNAEVSGSSYLLAHLVLSRTNAFNIKSKLFKLFCNYSIQTEVTEVILYTLKYRGA